MSYYKNITNLLDLFCSVVGIVVRTFVLANICLVGEKAKIVHFISKNKVFKILFIKVYHFHPPHSTTPYPPSPITYHHYNSPSPKTTNHNKIIPSTTLQPLPHPTNYTTLQNHKTNQPTFYHNPPPPKKIYKIKHYTQLKPKTSKTNYKTIPPPPIQHNTKKSTLQHTHKTKI